MISPGTFIILIDVSHDHPPAASGMREFFQYDRLAEEIRRTGRNAEVLAGPIAGAPADCPLLVDADYEWLAQDLRQIEPSDARARLANRILLLRIGKPSGIFAELDPMGIAGFVDLDTLMCWQRLPKDQTHASIFVRKDMVGSLHVDPEIRSLSSEKYEEIWLPEHRSLPEAIVTYMDVVLAK